MTNGFCPSCNRVVMTKREDINFGLACFLFIFTAGIGLFIYLLIYMSQPEDRCIFCGTQISGYLPPSELQKNYDPRIHNRGIPGPPGEVTKNQYPYEKSYQPKLPESTDNVNDFNDNLQYNNSAAENFQEISGNSGNMASKFCPFCGTECETGQRYCTSCGAELRN